MSEASIPAVTPRRILVVDDEGPVREVIQRLLQRSGYAVATAPNGRLASQTMAKESFDLVLTDLLMPDRDGLELIAEIRRRYPGTPVIAMSGGGRIHREQYLQMAKSLGARTLLGKPFDPDQLLTAVKAALEPGASD